jgi:hypothetical protein
MIDRIGKGGAPPPVTGTQGTPAAEKTGKTFEVGNAQEASKTQQATPVGAVEPSPLDQLKAGKIDFDGYLDLKVKEATTHLHGLAPSQIDSIRSMLRDRMATDPELLDLVKQATGHVPSIPEE